VTHVAVIIGSTRQGRFGDKPARWIQEQLEARPGVSVDLLDLLDFPLPFFDDALAPGRRGDAPIADPAVAAWSAAIDRADAFVIIAPEYNHGYPAVLKNAIDHLYREWVRKPVAFVGYGNAGGARSIEQLRQVAIELEMAPVKRAVAIPTDLIVKFMFEGIEDLDFSSAQDATDAMIDDLLWWASALEKARTESLAVAA
jgi:NAD(P)H-dependent FMN reductase